MNDFIKSQINVECDAEDNQEEYCMMCQHPLSEASSCTHPYCKNKQDEMPDESPDIFYLDSRSCIWSYRDEYAESTVAISKAKAKQDKLDLLKALIAIRRDKSYHLIGAVIDKLKQEIEGE